MNWPRLWDISLYEIRIYLLRCLLGCCCWVVGFGLVGCFGFWVLGFGFFGSKVKAHYKCTCHSLIVVYGLALCLTDRDLGVPAHLEASARLLQEAYLQQPPAGMLSDILIKFKDQSTLYMP